MKPRVFITGAGGFIGRHSAQEFARRGWRVGALQHRSPMPPEIGALERDGCLETHPGDVTDPASLQEAIGNPPPRAIVHCAGRATDVGRRREFRQTNLDAVEHLVRLCRECEVDRFVFVSTTDVYGIGDFHGEGEEELLPTTAPANPYPEFKIAAEACIRAGLPPDRYSILRPGAVWGPGDPTLTPRIVAFLRASPWIVHFGPWRGRNRWPLAHVRNVAAALYLATVQPEAAGTAINVLDSETTTVEEWYRLLADIYLPGKRCRGVVLPLWLGLAFGRAVSGISTFLNLRRPFLDPSCYAVRSVSANLDFSNARMLELFQRARLTPVSREQGLQELRRSIEH
ncbi:MAG: NAD(P)-dependent oxidoreductase [Lentisphaeria bacterium]|nr:NAD(P)-dependent oxidoreductase [Lentisphaeria bacterium]